MRGKAWPPPTPPTPPNRSPPASQPRSRRDATPPCPRRSRSPARAGPASRNKGRRRPGEGRGSSTAAAPAEVLRRPPSIRTAPRRRSECVLHGAPWPSSGCRSRAACTTSAAGLRAAERCGTGRLVAIHAPPRQGPSPVNRRARARRFTGARPCRGGASIATMRPVPYLSAARRPAADVVHAARLRHPLDGQGAPWRTHSDLLRGAVRIDGGRRRTSAGAAAVELPRPSPGRRRPLFLLAGPARAGERLRRGHGGVASRRDRGCDAGGDRFGGVGGVGGGQAFPRIARRLRSLHLRSRSVSRGLHLVQGGARLVVAAAVISAVAYVLSWQILYGGPVGSDTLFHLHLARWVDSSFPALRWWYPWDDHGIAYREGYPLAAHWTAVAISRLGALDLSQAIQVVQFATAPLGAVGIYCFCAWRLRNPLAGLVASIAYLLSPLTWTFLVDWGFYSNQVGTVLFMPALFALDVFFDEWSAGRRGWRFRASAFATTGLVALLGLVSPFLLGAAVIAVFMYALAIRGRGLGARARWLFVTAPLLLVGTFLLTAFWSVPEQLYLSFIGTHVPARAFDPGLFSVWSLDQVFGPVSYTHLRAHETRHELVCRLLLE